MSGEDTGDRTDIDRALRVVVPAGVAVVVGLVVVVAVGIAMRIEGLSAGAFLRILLIGVMLLPVYRLAPWRSGTTEQVRRWFRFNRVSVGVAAGLILASRLPFAPELFATLIQFPFRRTAGFFFAAELFYRPHVGAELGRYVRKFGQWYVLVLLVFVVSRFVVAVGRRIRADAIDH